MEEGGVAEGVGPGHVFEVSAFPLGEAYGQEGGGPLNVVGDAGAGQGCVDQAGEAIGVGVDGVVAGFVGQGEGGQACGHGHGVSGEGAGLVDGAVGGEVAHDVGAAAEGCGGKASGDDFSEGDEVPGDAVDAVPAVAGGAETGHHFVEDEQGAVGVGDLFEFGVEAGVGGDGAHVAGGGFCDDAGDGVGVGGEGGAHGVEVVVGHDDGVGGGDAGGVGQGEGGDPGAGGHEEAVDVTVVAAGEFEDGGASGVAAGEADGAHGGFGAGVDESDFFDGGAVDNGGGQEGFGLGGGTEAQAAGGGVADGVDDGGVGVAVEHGAPGADEVDVGVAVDVGEVGALAAGEEHGGAANRAEGADGGVDATGDQAAGLGEKGG